jgi:hypothetical protein
MCEQIRQYTIGILSMDARYMSPDEVIPVPNTSMFLVILPLFHLLPKTITLMIVPIAEIRTELKLLGKCFEVGYFIKYWHSALVTHKMCMFDT